MYKVDSARLLRDAARQKRNAEGAVTGILAGLTFVSASVVLGNDYSAGPLAVFLILLVLWLRAARKFQSAVTNLARAEAKVIEEQDKFDAELNRKLEW